MEIHFHHHVELLFYYLENVKWKLDPEGFPCVFITSLLEKIKSIQYYWRKIIVKYHHQWVLSSLVLWPYGSRDIEGMEKIFFSCVWSLIKVIRTNRRYKLSGHIALDAYYYLLPEPDVLKKGNKKPPPFCSH